MRKCVFALIAAAALASAASASAQMLTAAPITIGPSSSASNNAPGSLGLSKFYLQKVTALSYKIVETRAEDGGKLTPEHLANLQHELDHLNRQYDVRISLRVRAA